MPWKQVGSAWQGGAGDVALLSKTSCLVAGGQNGGTFGTFVADASKGTLNQTLSIKAGLSMIYAVALSTTSDTAVAMGPALFGSPISYKSSDRGITWSPSPEKAKGIIGTVAGSEVRSLGGESFAYVAEFNGFENGTKCDHGQPEGDLRQCSGVLLTHDAGDHWQRVDWHGTDGRGVDAVHGAFPSADVWYIAGGAQYSDADPPKMQALITKTADGGKTFKTIFNNSKVGAQLYAGVGNMVGVDCSDEKNCYAISACGISACEAPQPTPGKYNKTRGYGSYVLRTTDGGASWSTLHFEYEKNFDAVQALSPTHVVLGVSPTGALALGGSYSLHSTDAGATWSTQDIKGGGAGVVMGMALAADGQSGFASSCNAGLNRCGVWAYAA